MVLQLEAYYRGDQGLDTSLPEDLCPSGPFGYCFVARLEDSLKRYWLTHIKWKLLLAKAGRNWSVHMQECSDHPNRLACYEWQKHTLYEMARMPTRF